MKENFENFEVVKSKITAYYEMRNDVGRDGIEKTEGIESLANSKIEELNKLKKEIDEILEKTGLEFNPETCTIEQKEYKEVDEDTRGEIERTKSDLTETSKEYSDVTSKYVGEPETSQGEHEKPIVPMKVIVMDQKKQLYDKDVQAKKILSECADLEKTKDAMDMNAAIYVAKKNAILLQMEQTKLEIARSIANGEKLDSQVIQVCQQRLSRLALEAVSLAKGFEESNRIYQGKCNSCMESLNAATTEAVLLEKQSAGLSNKYEKCLVYSEDGILTGTEAQGRINDRDFEQKEVFDERGVMVFDEADVLSRTKTINIEGTVVTCHTDFNNNGIENSYYVGDSSVASIDTSTQGEVDENPDITEDVQKAEAGEVNGLSVYESSDYMTTYMIDGVAQALNDVAPEKRAVVGSALLTLGYNKQKHDMNPISLTSRVIEKIIENSIDNSEDEIPFNQNRKPY